MAWKAIGTVDDGEKSVASVDVREYARKINQNQSNKFPNNIGYRCTYTQNSQNKKERDRGRGRGRGRNYGNYDHNATEQGSWGTNKGTAYSYNEHQRHHHYDDWKQQQQHHNRYSRGGGHSGGYKKSNRGRGYGGYTNYRGHNNYDYNDVQQGRQKVNKERGHNNNNNNNNYNEQEAQKLNINDKLPWNASKEQIAEVRKYGSHEFYLNENIKSLIRYQDKIISMKNDYDERIDGAFIGDMEDWEEWFHGYCHDAFNKKDINYFKTKLMPRALICGKNLKDGTHESRKIMRRIVHEMALSGWTQGVEYMHQLFGDTVFTVLSNQKNSALHQAAYKLHYDTVKDMIKMGAKYDLKSGYNETFAQVAKAGFYELLTKTPLIPLVRCHTAPQLIKQLNLLNVDDGDDEKSNEDHLTDQKLDELIKIYYEEQAAKSKKKAVPFNELRINENIRLSDKQYQERVNLLRLLVGCNTHTFDEIAFSLESCYYGTIMDVYYYVCSFYINCWYKSKDSGNQKWIFSQCLTDDDDDGNLYGTISCKQQQLNGRILSVIPEGGQKRLELREYENGSKPSDNQLFRFELERKCDENGYKIWCRIISKSGYALIVDYDETPYSNASLRIRNAVIRCTQSFPDPYCRDLFTPFPYCTSNRKTSKLYIASGNKQYNIGAYKILFQHCKFWKKELKKFNKIQCYAASVYLIGQLYDKLDGDFNNDSTNNQQSNEERNDNETKEETKEILEEYEKETKGDNDRNEMKSK